jgi:hypothetical protein
MSNHLIERINTLDRLNGRKAPPARLIESPFKINHRGELIKEMRDDADVLDAQVAEIMKRSAEITHRALALRLAADHLEAHPPDA